MINDNLVEITKFLDKSYPETNLIKIIETYQQELQRSPSMIDKAHAKLLLNYRMYLSNNDFLEKINSTVVDFYSQNIKKYSDLNVIINGRIKSLERLELKFNRYIIDRCYKYVTKNGTFPSEEEMVSYLNRFKDIIAYRIIIDVPDDKLKGRDKDSLEVEYLYKIANTLPAFFTKKGFSIESSDPLIDVNSENTSGLNPEVAPFIKDYISNPQIRYKNGNSESKEAEQEIYRSLHSSFLGNIPIKKNYPVYPRFELQLKSFSMHKDNELGEALNHSAYVGNQNAEILLKQESLPTGICKYCDKAIASYKALADYDYTNAKVDMFEARRLSNGSLAYTDFSGLKDSRKLRVDREFLTN